MPLTITKPEFSFFQATSLIWFSLKTYSNQITKSVQPFLGNAYQRSAFRFYLYTFNKNIVYYDVELIIIKYGLTFAYININNWKKLNFKKSYTSLYSVCISIQTEIKEFSLFTYTF